MNIPLGVVLAGGLSRRMGGGDKSLLELHGKPIMQRVIDRIAPQVEQLAINANGSAKRFSEFELPVIADSIDGFAGPLAGVLAGLDWAAEKGATHIVTVAADTPFFPADLVRTLQITAEKEGYRIAVAATKEAAGSVSRHPTFGYWSVDMRDDLRSALNDGLRKVATWTDSCGSVTAMFARDRIDPFFNINTPEDMALATSLMSEGSV